MRDTPPPTIPPPNSNSASCHLQAEWRSGSGTHGAQRWPPGRAPGWLFHASPPDLAQQPSVCSPGPRAMRWSSAATAAGSLLGTAVPGPSPGAPGRRHALQAPKDRCLGGRSTLLRPGLACALTSRPSMFPRGSGRRSSSARCPAGLHSQQPGAGRGAYDPRFTGEGTEDQRGEAPCPGPHSPE